MINFITYFIALFLLQLAVSYTHYLISTASEFFYYMFCYGCLALTVGSALLYRWASVTSPADLDRKCNQDIKAAKADQNSLKYGAIIMSSSVLVIALSFIISG